MLTSIVRPDRRRAPSTHSTTIEPTIVETGCSWTCSRSVARSTSSLTSAVNIASSRTAASISSARCSAPMSGWCPNISIRSRKLVNGVRSSCLASETSRRCWALEVSSASRSLLKLVARSPTSSRRRVSIRSGSDWLSASAPAASATRVIGLATRCAMTQPNATAATTPSPPTVRSRRLSAPSESRSEVTSCPR